MLTPVVSLLISGVALAAIAAKVVSMQGDLEKTAADRRKQQSEQVNASSVAMVKSLLSGSTSNPPAIYPEPYLRTATSTAAEMATKLVSTVKQADVWGSDQTANSWGIILPAGSTELNSLSRFSTIRISVPDSSRIDPSLVFSSTTGGVGALDPSQASGVTVRLLAINVASGSGLVPVASADFALSVPMTGKAGAAGKTSNLSVRVDIPLPPAPTCKIEKSDPTTARLLVSGVATTATLQDTSGNPLGNPVSPNPAVSAYGRDVLFLTATTNLPIGALSGNVEGPGGVNICGSPPTPSPTPRPSLACANSPTVRWSADGFLEHINEAFKPAGSGTPEACTGIWWNNGRSARGWGEGMTKIDWNLASKIGYEEPGHSITRTVEFVDPPENGTFKLRIHRWRYHNHSPGVGIWMHWDRRVTWKNNIPFPWPINNRADYEISCDFTAGGGGAYSCGWLVKPLTLDDCSQSKAGCTQWQPMQSE